MLYLWGLIVKVPFSTSQLSAANKGIRRFLFSKKSLDEKTGKKLGGDALFQEIYPFIGRMPLGVNVVETAEAREILTEAGIL